MLPVGEAMKLLKEFIGGVIGVPVRVKELEDFFIGIELIGPAFYVLLESRYNVVGNRLLRCLEANHRNRVGASALRPCLSFTEILL